MSSLTPTNFPAQQPHTIKGEPMTLEDAVTMLEEEYPEYPETLKYVKHAQHILKDRVAGLDKNGFTKTAHVLAGKDLSNLDMRIKENQ